MNKILKLPICNINISIELPHVVHTQRMFNTFANTGGGKHSTLDKTVSSDLNKNLSTLCDKTNSVKSHKQRKNSNQISQVTVDTFDHNQQVYENRLYHQYYQQNTDQQYIHNTSLQTYWWPCYNPFLNQNTTPNTFTRGFHTQQVQRKKIKKHKYRANCAGSNIMSLRMWENTSEIPADVPGFIFTIMSYNVLAQDLVEQHPYLYLEHDSNHLSWPNRWKNIFQEISQFKPDILCLQEVQESHIDEYYSTLKVFGYEGIFKKRTGTQSDGCALYYRSSNVKMVDHVLVQFYQDDIAVLNRDNVGIVAKFVPKLHPTREFVVATTHLLYNPRRDDVRMAQMHLLLTDIEKISYKHVEGDSHYLPIIVTGDLNSPPHSDLYKFITHGDIRYEHLPEIWKTSHDPRRQQLVTSSIGITDNSEYLREVQKRLAKTSIVIDLTNDNSESNLSSFDKEHCDKRSNELVVDLTGDEGDSYVKASPQKEQCDKSKDTNKNYKKNKSLSHNFGLKSVYEHGSGATAEGTTHQEEWLTVDYIFYSIKKKNKKQSDKLQLLSRYRLPSCQELQGIRIPNTFIGSDHLSLIAKFKLNF